MKKKKVMRKSKAKWREEPRFCRRGDLGVSGKSKEL